MPMVFWASFEPWAKATAPAETGCMRRNVRFTGWGDQRCTISSRTFMIARAMAKPMIGEPIIGMTTLSQTPFQLTPLLPTATSVAPMRPPMRACDELEGSPKYQVIKVPADGAYQCCEHHRLRVGRKGDDSFSDGLGHLLAGERAGHVEQRRHEQSQARR